MTDSPGSIGQSGGTGAHPRRRPSNERESENHDEQIRGKQTRTPQNHQPHSERHGRRWVAAGRRWVAASISAPGPPGAPLGPGRLLSRPRRCFGRWKRTQCPSSCWSSVSRKIRTIRRTSARWCCSCRIRTGKPFPQNSRFRRRIWTRSSAPAACRCVRLGPLFQ